MPSFQREDNDRCENAHYILLINLTMRARRSRLTRVASVERAYVQGRGCGNEKEREREERGSAKEEEDARRFPFARKTPSPSLFQCRLGSDSEVTTVLHAHSNVLTA